MTDPGRRIGRLGAARRRPVRLAPEELVRARRLRDDRELPLLLEPAAPDVDLIGWAAQHRGEIDAHLLRAGAVLFRGFGRPRAADLERLIGALSGEALAYTERSSPRSRVEGHVYTSTDYPASQSIFFHNENSYADIWPLRLYFCCAQPAESGGETPIADTRRVLKRIDPEIRERFLERRVLYVRNFGTGLGLPWSTVFQTSDREEVETRCRRAGYQVQWRDGDRLTTRRVGPAIVRHPRSGELSWFNHAAFFHVSTFEAPVREALLLQFDEADLPNQTYYGDGAPIEPEVLDAIRDAYRRESVSFPWREGDVLVLDNMLTAHSRAPYRGARRVWVGMADAVSSRDPRHAP